MKVVDVRMAKSTICYILFVYFDNGSKAYFDLSNYYFRCHPSWISFSTQSGFVSRPKVVRGGSVLPFEIVEDQLRVHLPTCCGYLSRTSRWLASGSFHRLCVFNLDGLISSLYIS